MMAVQLYDMIEDILPAAVVEWLTQNNFGWVVEKHSVGGGCINHGARILTSSGQKFFIKTNDYSPKDMFAREAEGLTSLRSTDSLYVPESFLYDANFLLMEDLNPAGRNRDYWPEFGRGLAALHNHTSPQFGFAHDNYIGSTAQPNPWMADGYQFFGQHRLMFQAQLAARRGRLNPSQVKKVEQIVSNLNDLVPFQPASLIHGDLWSGNASSDQLGRPALIDPAAHYGWAEAELAMTALFGSFPDVFYQAYMEIRHLEPGFRQRFPIYNLYHLLNHLNLFGEGYLGEVLSVLGQFS